MKIPFPSSSFIVHLERLTDSKAELFISTHSPARGIDASPLHCGITSEIDSVVGPVYGVSKEGFGEPGVGHGENTQEPLSSSGSATIAVPDITDV
jgi:hypothetical protein